jgi:lipopolysaccharide export system protein LptC
MPSNWRILLSLLGLAGLIWWLWFSPPKELQDLITTEEQELQYPSSYVVGAETTQFDETGSPSYKMLAETIRYFEQRADHPTKPDMSIDKPSMTFFTNDELPWLATADFAEGKEKQDQLKLIGNVVLQKETDKGRPLQLKTDELLIKPSGRYAETDKPVIITDASGTTTSTGLKVFLDDERIELLSNVKNRYRPR